MTECFDIKIIHGTLFPGELKCSKLRAAGSADLGLPDSLPQAEDCPGEHEHAKEVSLGPGRGEGWVPGCKCHSQAPVEAGICWVFSDAGECIDGL